MQKHCFISFSKAYPDQELPKFFTNPFQYSPHPLCEQAVEQLQASLGYPDENEKGRMYGVLIVQNPLGELGFLAALSGNEQANSEIPFVPQVFEITNPDGFFRKGEKELNRINAEIEKEKNSPKLKQLISKLAAEKENTMESLQAAKLSMAKAKKERQNKRIELSEQEGQEHLLAELIKESQSEKSKFNQLKKDCKKRIEQLQENIAIHEQKINELKQIRKNKSAQLQKQIFDSYVFLNAKGIKKNTSEIFAETDAKVPPAGAGDCCAPKLLQYAFQNQMKPIAMAEFWWGKSPQKEIRKHGYYYPACKSKCEPILGHMLLGLDVEEKEIANKNESIKVLYEDDAIAIINKPSGLLSVPGKKEQESVYSQVKNLYPKAEEPLLVHRLDMATSGLLLIAKTKSAHEHLQKQFLNKSIQKRYVAVLDGIVEGDSGLIELPLRVDLNDRPRQLVCFEHGKIALTKWEVKERTATQSRIHFYPITGRTHQLRVHAAHPLGLNLAITGDELYGIKADRLLLHAEEIRFVHPVTEKEMSWKHLADF